MQALFEYLESKTEETIKTLGELVRIPTQVPPGENYGKIMDFAASKLKDLDFEVENIRVEDLVMYTKFLARLMCKGT
ncbi:MAG: hypothetical protein KKD69_07335 [Euryarchaeota archaeon]|nr:hypothetical protein [Euryarchaeota archaeon]